MPTSIKGYITTEKAIEILDDFVSNQQFNPYSGFSSDIINSLKLAIHALQAERQRTSQAERQRTSQAGQAQPV